MGYDPVPEKYILGHTAYRWPEGEQYLHHRAMEMKASADVNYGISRPLQG